MKKEKTATISAKVATEQQQELDKEAAECGMTRNQYIIARLFVDQDDTTCLKLKKLSNFDRDLISATTKGYFLIQLMAEKLLTKEDRELAFKKAEEILIKNGYKSKD